MRRSVQIGMSVLAILASTGGADAQYYGGGGFGGAGFGAGGYGGYGGFGGWSTSAIGNDLQGQGQLDIGEGIYNQDTAVADSINTDTVMRYNQYLYNSKIAAQNRYNATQARRLNMDKANFDARQARIKDNPNNVDIENGDALNAIYDQLSDPKLMHGSALRSANAPISPKAIKDIPFRDETDAITLSLDQLTDKSAWPLPLRSDVFTPEREAYEKAVDAALAEDTEGSLKPETIAKVRDAVARLARKVAETIPKTKQPDHLQATNYIRGLAGMSRSLERPNVEKLLSELEKVDTTSLGNLVGFMHAYNLRFAPAETPKQRAVYHDLYPLMVASRNKAAGQPGDNGAQANSNPPPAPQPAPGQPAVEGAPTDIFQGFKDTHLHSGTNPNP